MVGLAVRRMNGNHVVIRSKKALNCSAMDSLTVTGLMEVIETANQGVIYAAFIISSIGIAGVPGIQHISADGRLRMIILNLEEILGNKFRTGPELGVGGVRWTNRCDVLSRWPKDGTPLG